MPSQNEIDTANLAFWNELAGHHREGDYETLRRFRAGEVVLDPLVLSEMGAVDGLSLLHLQCHIGVDTLSFVRLGAQVTGVDYSNVAIATARALSAEAGLPGEFIHSRIETAPESIDRRFDRVFTSWGTFFWLPDLTSWGETIAHFLRPGGIFYMADGHPLANSVDDSKASGTKDLRIRYPCLNQTEALEWQTEESYYDDSVTVENSKTFDWNHGLGLVVTALCQAGLTIEYLHEHDFTAWQALPILEEADDGYFRLPDGYPSIPLSFSLRARKVA